MNILFSFKGLEPVGDIHRTKVTFRAQANLGGHIPESFVNSQTSGLLNVLGAMRIRFDKSIHIDTSARDAFVARITNYAGGYSVGEEKQITEGINRLKVFDKLRNTKKVESASPLVTSEIAQKEGDRNAFGKASTKLVLNKLSHTNGISWQDISKSLTRLINELSKTKRPTITTSWYIWKKCCRIRSIIAT